MEEDEESLQSVQDKLRNHDEHWQPVEELETEALLEEKIIKLKEHIHDLTSAYRSAEGLDCLPPFKRRKDGSSDGMSDQSVSTSGATPTASASTSALCSSCVAFCNKGSE
eukprot:3936284-Rhodomonas_salina.2